MPIMKVYGKKEPRKDHEMLIDSSAYNKSEHYTEEEWNAKSKSSSKEAVSKEEVSGEKEEGAEKVEAKTTNPVSKARKPSKSSASSTSDK